MSLSATDPNKRKQPRRFDTKTLAPKTHWQNLVFNAVF